ncbi:MAG: slipin family protein [Ruminococcaceae bacterium]|nr:slipin family protein [Oscillospiraceae bacterium]
MTTIIINEDQRGLLFRNGRYEKLLGAGKYRLFGGRSVQVCDVAAPVSDAEYKVLAKDADAVAQLAVVQVKDQQLALHYVNGVFCDALKAGTHAFWAVSDKHEFSIVDITEPEFGEDIPRYIIPLIDRSLYSTYHVYDHEKGLLYYDQKMVRVLEPGTYHFWKNNTVVSCCSFDTRQRSMEVNGQSVLTKDKVELRITFVLTYRITDCVKIAEEIDDSSKQLYTAAQLTLRELAGRYRMDELLEDRERLSKETAEILREKASRLYMEVIDAGIRDIILPGEISSIMNTVLAAEKRAQANVITRREEVASTRSLLNTAKLMDENKTLYKLKELEYIERICENVGSISVESGKGLLSQLSTILAEK